MFSEGEILVVLQFNFYGLISGLRWHRRMEITVFTLPKSQLGKMLKFSLVIHALHGASHFIRLLVTYWLLDVWVVKFGFGI